MKKRMLCLVGAFLAVCLLGATGCSEEKGADGASDSETTVLADTEETNAETTAETEAPLEELLAFALNEDGASYRVTGIGTCKGPELVIPAEYQGLPVTIIGNKAFRECGTLTSVTIPDSVTVIEYEAFYKCGGLTSVVIPDGVTKIGRAAFQYCGGLVSVSLGNGVVTIGEKAFSDCDGVSSIAIPDSVTSLGANALFIGGLTEITVGENNAVYRSIDGNLYSKDETSLLQYARGKSETVFAVPEGVTSIEELAFSFCNGLVSVTIPHSVTSIGGSAFSNCAGLTSVVIPDSVTAMGWYVFSKCESLTEIFCEAESKPTDWREDWIGSYTVPVHWGYQGQ